MMRAMRLGVLGLVAGVGLAMASASHAEPDRLRGVIEPVVAAKPFRIGVTLVHLNDDYWKGIAYGIVDEAKRSGVTVVQVSVAGGYGNVAQQFAQIEALRSLGVDVAVIGTAAFDGYNPILKSLKQGGMKIVAAGIPVNSAAVDFGITQDDKAIGAALGDVVCKAKGEKPATVLVIPGPAGAEWARLRHVGFDDQATKCQGLSVVDGAVGGALGLEHGLTEATDMLFKHPDAEFIYTPEISLGIGAVQATRQANSQAKIVSSSVVRESIPLVRDGHILADGSEPGILIGRLIVQYLIRSQDHLPTPALEQREGSLYPTVVVPNELITKANVDTYPFDLYEIPPQDWSIQAFQ